MERLRELRKSKGISLKELGTIIGVAESTMSLYESGKRQPDYETLLKLAEYYGKDGKICMLFCRNASNQLRALSTTSEKVYEALGIISMIYREHVGNGIPIRIRSYQTGSQGRAFTLEVLNE